MEIKQEDLTKLVEMYYGEDYVFGSHITDGRKGSDYKFDSMKNFLEKLNEAGYVIRKKHNCKCGKH